MLRSLLAAVFLSLCSAFGAPGASAQVCSCAGDLSDGFEDGVLTWIPSATCGFVVETSGTLRTVHAQCEGYSQARLEPSVCGEFDLQIDCSSSNFVAAGNVGTRAGGMRVETAGGSPVMSIEIHNSAFSGGCIPAPLTIKAYAADSTACLASWGTYDSNMRFRITRQGSTVKAYYQDSSGPPWVELHSATGPLGDLHVYVYGVTIGDTGNFAMIFDNFSLTSELCPTPAMPATWGRLKDLYP